MTSQLFTDFPELSSLSREDLEDLIADPSYFQAVFHNLPRVRAILQGQAELDRANESIAQNNLNLQQPLFQLRTDTQAAFDDAKALEARWKTLEREQAELYQRYTPAFLLMRLKHATTAQDELSESHANTFVQSSSNSDEKGAADATGREVDEFVRTFREQRKIYHKRALWVERWGTGNVHWRDHHDS